MGYALPTSTSYVSCSWQCHKDRPTPSSEPGTDYGVAYGSPLYAVENGRVTYTRTHNGGPTGRYIEYVLDDGRTTRSLHLSEVWVKPGDRVTRGQQIGKTGASGNGSDWGYGAHVHQTLWPGAAWAAPTLDFALYVGPGSLEPTQRRAGSKGANGRTEPSSQSTLSGDPLAPGAVGNFIGWIRGEAVEGNNVWFQGTSKRWFWSGGFDGGANTAGLADLNPPPAAGNERTVGANGVNGRNEPNTKGPVTQTLGPNTTWAFNAWAAGETISGNSTWFRGANSGDWFWSGGFTSQSTANLPKVDVSPEPPANPDNPLNLPQYPPVYPRAFRGLKGPLGFLNDGSPALRNTAGAQPVDPIIDRFIIHHTATTVDQLRYFSEKNDRSVCPSFYLRTDGKVFEMIRPLQKPATTGPNWNWRSLSVETLNSTGDPTWEVTDAQVEELAQMIAWLAEYDGKELDGVPVSFKIDRTHVISHREVAATACPGPYLQPRLDAIVARAKAIYDERHPPIVTDYIVPREVGEQIRNLINEAFPVTE